MSSQQNFTDPRCCSPVPEGSIHRARLAAGTTIPVHTHPADEHVLVLSGTAETGGRRCEVGTIWTTPAGIRQGPHLAITDVELPNRTAWRDGAIRRCGMKTAGFAAAIPKATSGVLRVSRILSSARVRATR
jgi:hypothetical protein